MSFLVVYESIQNKSINFMMDTENKD